MERLDLRPATPLQGKRILVTGGSQGIGRALALAFLKDEARVAVCARRSLALEPLQRAGALVRPADVAEPEAVERLFESIEREWGGLDALVNNAAVLRPGRLAEQGPDEWRECLEVNLTGPFLVARRALRSMEKGSIVNLTSGLGMFPMETYGAYAVSKAGLNMLTRMLALELRGRVRVNAVNPGVARTRMNPSAAIPAEAVVPVVRALVALAEDGPSGRCFKSNGSEMPWGIED